MTLTKAQGQGRPRRRERAGALGGPLGPRDSDMRIHLRPRPLDPYSYLGVLWQFPHSPRPFPECRSSREPESWRKQMNSAAVAFLCLPRRPFMLVQNPHHSAEPQSKAPRPSRNPLAILPLCRRFRRDGLHPVASLLSLVIWKR